MARVLEHHALTLLRAGGIATPDIRVVSDEEAARAAARELGGRVVVKALIPAGGRGKAGAVRMVPDADAAADATADLLGREVLHFPVHSVLISAPVAIEREFFVSIAFDSQSRRPIVLCSATGGVDVEDTSSDDPASMVRRTVDPTLGLRPFEAREIANDIGLRSAAAAAFATTLEKLYALFVQIDALTLEINPLALVAGNAFVAASCVLVTDDLAAFRHPELEGIADPDITNGWRPLTNMEHRMRAIDREDPDSPIRFNEFPDGEIAFMAMGGGAGFFALDTMLALGGKPATTFDITPGRFEAKLRAAVAVVAARPGLRGFFAGGNISNFMPIDMRVRAIVDGLRDAGVDPATMPVVFRFDGPRIEEAKAIASSLPGIRFSDAATTLDEAVAQIVELAS